MGAERYIRPGSTLKIVTSCGRSELQYCTAGVLSGRSSFVSRLLRAILVPKSEPWTDWTHSGTCNSLSYFYSIAWAFMAHVRPGTLDKSSRSRPLRAGRRLLTAVHMRMISSFGRGVGCLVIGCLT